MLDIYLAVCGYLLEDTGQVPGPPPTLGAVAPHRGGKLWVCLLTVLYTSFIPAGRHTCGACVIVLTNTYLLIHICMWHAAIHNNWKIRDIKLD